MKILVLSIFPAPYRLAIFKGIRKVHELTVFFERVKDGERNKDWFQKQENDNPFYILSEEKGQKAFLEAKKRLKEYDLVICYDPLTSEARKLESLCIKKRIPYIVNVDGAVGINKNPLKSIIKRYYFKRAIKCFAGCQRAVEYLNFYGVKEKNIEKHNFTSLYYDEILKTPISESEKSALKKELGLADKTTFITIGQFIHRKGFDILLKAWEKVTADCQLLIIGGGKLRAEYEKTIAENKTENVFIYDYMPHDQIMTYLKASDCFIMPTREDIWGLVVNEAMSVGLPVISSDKCTSANELVENGVNGYIYSVEDTDALANIVNNEFSICDKFSFSQNALNRISSYTYENIIEGHIKVLENLK